MAFSVDVTQGRSPPPRLVQLIRWALEQRRVRFAIVGGINIRFAHDVRART